MHMWNAQRAPGEQLGPVGIATAAHSLMQHNVADLSQVDPTPPRNAQMRAAMHMDQLRNTVREGVSSPSAPGYDPSSEWVRVRMRRCTGLSANSELAWHEELIELHRTHMLNFLQDLMFPVVRVTADMLPQPTAPASADWGHREPGQQLRSVE